MRDPKRIHETLALLEKAWRRYPDLRLAQLISNAAAFGAPSRQLFYVEDEDLLRGLQELIEERDKS